MSAIRVFCWGSHEHRITQKIPSMQELRTMSALSWQSVIRSKRRLQDYIVLSKLYLDVERKKWVASIPFNKCAQAD
jgi:hypothetical protein